MEKKLYTGVGGGEVFGGPMIAIIARGNNKRAMKAIWGDLSCLHLIKR